MIFLWILFGLLSIPLLFYIRYVSWKSKVYDWQKSSWNKHPGRLCEVSIGMLLLASLVPFFGIVSFVVCCIIAFAASISLLADHYKQTILSRTVNLCPIKEGDK